MVKINEFLCELIIMNSNLIGCLNFVVLICVIIKLIYFDIVVM